MATSIVMRAPVRPIPALQHGKRKKIRHYFLEQYCHGYFVKTRAMGGVTLTLPSKRTFFLTTNQ